MMNNEISNFEEKVLNLLKGALNQFRPLLEKENLRYQINKLKISGRGVNYRSEIDVEFLDGTEIVDVIEFFIFYDGKPKASIEEIKEWLKETLEDVLNRRRSEKRFQ